MLVIFYCVALPLKYFHQSNSATHFLGVGCAYLQLVITKHILGQLRLSGHSTKYNAACRSYYKIDMEVVSCSLAYLIVWRLTPIYAQLNAFRCLQLWWEDGHMILCKVKGLQWRWPGNPACTTMPAVYLCPSIFANVHSV